MKLEYVGAELYPVLPVELVALLTIKVADTSHYYKTLF